MSPVAAPAAAQSVRELIQVVKRALAGESCEAYGSVEAALEQLTACMRQAGASPEAPVYHDLVPLLFDGSEGSPVLRELATRSPEFLVQCSEEIALPAQAMRRVQLLDDLATLYPDVPFELEQQRFVALERAGRHDRAYDWIARRQAEGREPLASSFGQLAALLCALGRDAELEAVCRQRVTHCAGDADAWRMLGEVLADRGQFDEAEYALRRSNGAFGSSAETHQLLGHVLTATGQSDAADRHYAIGGRLALCEAEPAVHLTMKREWRESITSFRELGLLAIAPSATPPTLSLAHIGHVGETSAMTVFHRGFRAWESFLIPGPGTERELAWQQLASMSDERRSTIRFLHNHGRFRPLERDLAERCLHVCLVRDPVRRALSDYHWSVKHRREPWAPEHIRAGATLDEHVSHPRAMDVSESQCERLLSALNLSVSSELKGSDLGRAAAAVLDERYLFFGLTELFDESLFILHALLGLDRIPLWELACASGARPPEQIDSRIRARIKERWAADVWLYESKSAQFVERYAGMIEFFRTEIGTLDRANVERLSASLTTR